MLPKLKVENISMIYQTIDDETPALKKISFDVYDGEFICLVGPSGCGKSTLLSIISGLLNPSEGTVYIDDAKMSYPCSKIAYMPQKDHLFEWRTIYKNITVGLEIQKKLTKQRENEVSEMIKKYGLDGFRNYYPNQLSGGMRQRVALIRTLAVNPEILLLDEPFSALDFQTRLAVCDEVYSIIKAERKTAIMVTHDISEAISLSDRVIVLSKRPGEIKNIHNINLSIEDRTPLKSREAPEFRNYFNTIWKELDIHVE